MIEPLLARALASRPVAGLLRRLALYIIAFAALMAGLGFLLAALYLALAAAVAPYAAALISAGVLFAIGVIAALVAALLARDAALRPRAVLEAYVRERPAESLAAALLSGILSEWIAEPAGAKEPPAAKEPPKEG